MSAANDIIIVIAEDEQMIRELIRFSLEKANYTVLAASNGREALDLILENDPDLIILDIRMPEMDGYEVMRALKGDSATQTIPVIFLTAKTQDADVLQGLDMGAVEYIKKPFSPRELVARVKGVLQRQD